MSVPVVAVIDIGSNTIKLLVARREPGGRPVALATRTEEARISQGLAANQPRLTEAGMERGLTALRLLLDTAAPHRPAAVALVATSAVRDAANGPEFAARVQATTGQALRILDGESEARLIGRGLTCDPALAGWRNFHVFDLGGGSLEHLVFRDGEVQLARSLALGCVRLTEAFVSEPSAPLPAETSATLRAHVLAALGNADLVRPGEPAVFTGGSMTTTRAMLGAARGLDLPQTPPHITTAELRQLSAEIRPLPLPARLARPGLTAGRADVFPAALVTLLTVAEWGRFDRFTHSLHNLRWGLAAELLDRLPPAPPPPAIL